MVVWYRVIIVSALSLSLRDKERFRDWEIERAWQLSNPKNPSSTSAQHSMHKWIGILFTNLIVCKYFWLVSWIYFLCYTINSINIWYVHKYFRKGEELAKNGYNHEIITTESNSLGVSKLIIKVTQEENLGVYQVKNEITKDSGEKIGDQHRRITVSSFLY